jgi:hypothetical protein
MDFSNSQWKKKNHVSSLSYVCLLTTLCFFTTVSFFSQNLSRSLPKYTYRVASRMTPKSLLDHQEIKFIFDSEPVVKTDEPGVVCNLCHKFVTDFHRYQTCSFAVFAGARNDGS